MTASAALENAPHKLFEEHVDPRTGERSLAVSTRGSELKNEPLLNKGTCFTLDERKAFGLEGLLPPGVSTPAEQEARVWGNYLQSGNDIQRYLFLTGLQDRNETVFYRLLVDHIEEMAPIVYTPTVGKACQLYSHIYRRPRGVYITPEHRGRIVQLLRNAPIDDCKVMVVTDNEAILGLGDLGVGGMGIPIGKLTLYTAGAGFHPATCLPIDLDPGTENEELLRDPMYLGLRRPRLRGDAYFAFLDEFVDAVNEVFPNALIQWEDFANENAFQILERYRDRCLSFDDDIQGTAAVVTAGILAGLHRAGRSLKDERALFFGVGAAGGGCARMLRRALELEGLTPDEIQSRVLCMDSRGLLVSNRPGISGHKRDLACDPAVLEGWDVSGSGPAGLPDVVRNFHPTILAGMSGRPGSFTQEIVQTMHEHCPRPIVLPLSNPNSHAEAVPADLLRWTRGGAIVATGSPFPPVEYAGVSYEIGQANNVLIFPGVGLGAVAVGASRIPDEAFLAAAMSLRDIAAEQRGPTAPLFPPLSGLRHVSHLVAFAVGRSLVETGAAPAMDDAEIEQRIRALIWEPAFLPYVPAT